MTKYREAFSWTRSIDDFVRWHVTETPLLNVCAGRTPWGDVTLDLHEPADVQGSWDALPFERDSFAAVFADPPWDSGHKAEVAAYMREALRDAFSLPRPGTGGWTTALEDDGATTEVAQVAYGHETRKRTWLYAVGCELPALDWREPRATKQVSALGLTNGKSKFLYANVLDKNRSDYTPESFRDALLNMARSASQVVA